MVFSKDEEIFMVLEFVRGNGPTAVKRACVRKFGPEMKKFTPKSFSRVFERFLDVGVGHRKHTGRPRVNTPNNEQCIEIMQIFVENPDCSIRDAAKTFEHLMKLSFSEE